MICTDSLCTNRDRRYSENVYDETPFFEKPVIFMVKVPERMTKKTVFFKISENQL